MKRVLLYSILFFTFFNASKSFAQIPAGYYDAATGMEGEALKKQLHKIINEHKVFTYAEIRDILRDVDEDPSNPDNILLIYKGTSIPKTNFASNSEPDFWNREHTWPKSHGFPNEADTAYTDAHMLRPSDATVNSSRSNKDFNDVEHIEANEEGEAANTYTTDDFFEPRPEIKGDLARIMFYMDVRYESKALDLELVDRISYTDDPELGVLYTLLQWHENDPVSDEERARNNAIYTDYQNNRNPFVDNPDWVASIYGKSTDPLLIVDQNAFSVDFGLVKAGTALTQSYSLTAYNLTSDVTITTEAPFSLSLNGTDFSNSVTVTNVGTDSKQVVTVYLKFAPTVADKAVYNKTVTHTTTGALTRVLDISGQEGEIPLSTIAEARAQSPGTTVKIAGVVIDRGNNSGNSRVVFDGTAGLVVRSFDSGNESAALEYGDSVLVTGVLAEFKNLLQISESPIIINVIKKNAVVPEPQEITLAQIGESYESELVIVKNVSFVEQGATFGGGGTAGNFTITDGTVEVIFRIGDAGHPLAGTTVPTGYYDVIGFIGQFDADYQLSPRSADDLIFVSDNSPTLNRISIEAARTQSVGTEVKVTGVVIDGVGNSAANRTIYDGTAGINIRGLDEGNLTSSLILGDSVTVIGFLSDYNGLAQIAGSPVSITLHKQNAQIPLPQQVSIADVGENYESELVTLNNVSFSASGTFKGGGADGEYTLTDGTNEFKFKLGTTSHPLVGTSIPSGILSITGVIGQDASGYYISPRVVADIVVVEEEITGLSQDIHQLRAYPNPTTGILFIESLAGTYDVTVMDLTGKELKSTVSVDGRIDLSGLNKGIYFIRVVKPSNDLLIKVIKE